MAPRLGHLLYFVASLIAVIMIAGGVVVWLYFARPNYDPLGLGIVGTGIDCLACGPCDPALAFWSINIECGDRHADHSLPRWRVEETVRFGGASRHGPSARHVAF